MHELSKLYFSVNDFLFIFVNDHCMYIKITWINIPLSICEDLYKRKYLLNFKVTFSKANWSRMIKIRVFYLENDAMQVLNVQ